MKSKYNSVLNLWVNSWIKLGRIQMFSIVVFGVIVLGEYTAHAVVISRGHRTYFTSDEGGMDYKKIIHLTDAYWGDPKGVYPLEKVHLYKDASQILILGDGEHGDCTEAEHMAPSSSQIYCTGIRIKGKQKWDNVVKQYLDHTEIFPFSDNSMDTVILRRGLCHCWGNRVSCGGIENDSVAMASFLSEVSRVMNKGNPASGAYLDGRFFGDFSKEDYDQFLDNWDHAIEATQTVYPQLKYTLAFMIYGSSEGVKNRFRRGEDILDLKLCFLGVYVSVAETAKIDSDTETANSLAPVEILSLSLLGGMRDGRNWGTNDAQRPKPQAPQFISRFPMTESSRNVGWNPPTYHRRLIVNRAGQNMAARQFVWPTLIRQGLSILKKR